MSGKTIVLFALLSSCILKSQQNWSWLVGSDFCSAVTVADVKVGANGNSYITAAYWGSIAVGGGTLTSQGGTDSFLAKLNQNGNMVWNIPFSGTGTDFFNDLCLDSQGNLFCVGVFSSPTIALGSQTLATTFSSSCFLCKIDPAGQVIWLGSSLKGEVMSPVIQINGSGIYLSGTFSGTLTAAGSTIISIGGADYFIAKYDYSGNLIWLVGNGGSNNDYINDITILSTGEPVVCGHFYSSSINYGSFTVTGNGTPFANPTTLLAKYNSAGALQWAQSIPSLNLSLGKLSANPFGDYYFGGTFNGTVSSLGSFSFTSAGAGGFISKIDKDGNIIWAKDIPSSGNVGIKDIVSDQVGDVIGFGDFNGASASLGSYSITNDSTTVSMFLCYLNASGTPLSLETFGGKYTNYSNCLDVAANGDLIVAGYSFGKKMELGNLSISQPTSGTFMFVGKTSSLLTGVSELTPLSSYNNVYPNPCTDFAYFIFEGKIDDIQLYDISGKRMNAEFEHLPERTIIRLTDLAVGLYLLQVKSSSKMLNYKIIKQE